MFTSESDSLSVHELRHSFKEYSSNMEILKGVSLEARRGQITSITGPSGCGKSTLLYLMGLLDKPDSGKIFLGDLEVQNLNDSERTKTRNQLVGFIFQFHFLIKELTVLENVRLPLLKLGMDRPQADHKVLELLSELGIADKSKRPAYKLSGGEQQRVAIARSLANSPKFLLADEPTGNLDSANSEIVFELLKHMAQKLNLAVALVTHNPKLAKLSDRNFQMKDGMILT